MFFFERHSAIGIPPGKFQVPSFKFRCFKLQVGGFRFQEKDQPQISPLAWQRGAVAGHNQTKNITSADFADSAD
jgi:hypothetical protein